MRAPFTRCITVLALLSATACAHSGGVRLTNAQRTAVTEIRAERAASNAAIARRDAAGYATSKLPTYRGTWGGGLTHHSRDSSQVSIAREFADTVLLGYVRTPTTVEVSYSGLSAAEHGRWTGRFRRPDGVQEVTGTYFATWHPTPEGWRLNKEGFCRARVLRRLALCARTLAGLTAPSRYAALDGAPHRTRAMGSRAPDERPVRGRHDPRE